MSCEPDKDKTDDELIAEGWVVLSMSDVTDWELWRLHERGVPVYVQVVHPAHPDRHERHWVPAYADDLLYELAEVGLGVEATRAVVESVLRKPLAERAGHAVLLVGIALLDAHEVAAAAAVL